MIYALRCILLNFTLLISSAAMAQENTLPALYDVFDVAANDTLNIRAEPSTAAPVVGTLSPDATSIEITGFGPLKKWARLNSNEQTGWVSLRYLTRQPNQTDILSIPVKSCFGTEPFWSINIETDDSVRFSQLGLDDASGMVTERIQASGRVNEMAYVLWFPEGGNGSATAIIKREMCNDGMSDRSYALSSSILLNTEEGTALLSGCCTLGR